MHLETGLHQLDYFLLLLLVEVRMEIPEIQEPLVRLVPLAAEPGPRRGGFLRGQATISADLKADFKAEIEDMFYGE